MEYIKKEELIKGEVYRHENGNLVQYLFDSNDTQIHGHFIGGKRNVFRNYNDMISRFTIIKLQLATSEEKHWLNCCITADKFITFEEAMKTFIPEYVECIMEQPQYGNYGELGKIYKVDNWDYTANDCMLNGTTSGSTSKKRFKSSTKEAYDAQFVVEKPEFVLPEKWCILRNLDNYTIINNWFKNNQIKNWTIGHNKGYLHSTILNGDWIDSNNKKEGYVEITFEQFKKYILKEEIVEEKVIEPLPQFKVIESIETITKVENNEGNQFFIGDTVKSLNSNQRGKITKFKYSNDKSDIIAITTFQQTNGISINKIEHYIEPKVEFILPEKWCITTTIENQSIIFDWLEKNTNWRGKYSGVDTNIGNHYCIEGKKCNGWMYYAPERKSGYKELTFEEFKKICIK